MHDRRKPKLLKKSRCETTSGIAGFLFVRILKNVDKKILNLGHSRVSVLHEPHTLGSSASKS